MEPAIQPDTIAAAASANQTELWLAEEIALRRGVYNVPAIYRCGRLDTERVKTALRGVTARFAALRTTFDVDSFGTLAQSVHSHVRDPEVSEIRCSSDAELETAMADCVWRPFDLAIDRPIRAHILHRADSAVLMLVFHHIAADEWSFLLLLDAFWSIYAGALDEREPPEAVTYTEWARREAEWLHTAEAAQSVDAIICGCRAFPRRLPPPLCPSRPQDQQHDAETSLHSVKIPGALRGALADVCKSLRVTDFVLGLGTFAIALERIGNAPRLVVCIAAANRVDEDFLGTVGPISNLIPVAIDLGSCNGLRDKLDAVQDAYLWALDYQDVPAGVWGPAVAADRDGERPADAFGVSYGRAEVFEAQLPADIEPWTWYGFRPARHPLAGFIDSQQSEDRLLVYAAESAIDRRQAAQLVREWLAILEAVTVEIPAS